MPPIRRICRLNFRRPPRRRRCRQPRLAFQKEPLTCSVSTGRRQIGCWAAEVASRYRDPEAALVGGLVFGYGRISKITNGTESLRPRYRTATHDRFDPPRPGSPPRLLGRSRSVGRWVRWHESRSGAHGLPKTRRCSRTCSG